MRPRCGRLFRNPALFEDIVISKKRIEKLQHDGLLKSTDDGSFDQCVSCLFGEMKRKPFPHRTKRATDLLGLIHTDVCCPLRHVSRQGSSEQNVKVFRRKRGRCRRFQSLHLDETKMCDNIKVSKGCHEWRDQFLDLENLSDADRLYNKLKDIEGGDFIAHNMLMCTGFYHKVLVDSERTRHIKQVYACFNHLS
ncbi:hypothetical protein Tco_0695309 [Tanacetum coccineum]